MKKNKPTITPQLLPAPGARVGIVCGPGEFPQDCAGTTLCHVTDRWGTHALVLMDAGDTRTVHGLTDVGIGAHLIAGQAAPAGYSAEYVALSRDHSLRILVAPAADLDGLVLAWDIEAREFVNLNGWMWEFERIGNENVQNQG